MLYQVFLSFLEKFKECISNEIQRRYMKNSNKLKKKYGNLFMYFENVQKYTIAILFIPKQKKFPGRDFSLRLL